MMLIGELWYGLNEDRTEQMYDDILFKDGIYYLKDRKEDSVRQEYKKEEIKEELNMEWCDSAISCHISFDDCLNLYKCIYKVIIYDFLSISIFGQGNTIDEAYLECKSRIAYINK